MKILYLCHRTPWPPSKGDKLRAFHQIRLLSRRHEVHLMALEDGSAGMEAEPKLAEHCRSVELFAHRRTRALLRCMVAALTGRAFTSAFFWSSELARAFRRRIANEGFDLVFASTAPMSQYFSNAVQASRVVDLMDVDSRKWQELSELAGFPRSFIFGLEARRIRRVERKISRESNHVLLVSSGEAALLEADLSRAEGSAESRPGATIEVVTNGVDIPSNQPSEPESKEPSLVLVGTMSYLPTVDGARYFVERIFPGLRRRFESLRFSLVGRDPHPSLDELKAVEGVEVTGEVDSIEPYLARAWVFVAPLRTAPGLQNKLLEAMAARVPVVCSRPCFEGLCDGRFVDGEDLLVCDDEQQYEAAVARLLDSEAERRAMASNAFQKLLASYDWEAVGDELERIVSTSRISAAATLEPPASRSSSVPRDRVSPKGYP